MAMALCGCGIIIPPEGSVIAVRQTVDDDYYASKQIGTPDVLAPCYPKGERLVLTWRISKSWLDGGPLELRLDMMYRDRSRQRYSWEVWEPVGSAVLACLGECYNDTCGFLTYNIQLYKGEELLLEQPHNLWFEWIEVASPPYGTIDYDTSRLQ